MAEVNFSGYKEGSDLYADDVLQFYDELEEIFPHLTYYQLADLAIKAKQAQWLGSIFSELLYIKMVLNKEEI